MRNSEKINTRCCWGESAIKYINKLIDPKLFHQRKKERISPKMKPTTHPWTPKFTPQPKNQKKIKDPKNDDKFI